MLVLITAGCNSSRTTEVSPNVVKEAAEAPSEKKPPGEDHGLTGNGGSLTAGQPKGNATLDRQAEIARADELTDQGDFEAAAAWTESVLESFKD